MTQRGQLRVYLGAAPGVGKTYAMLGEGRRRAARGTDVVVAFVETHGRPHTEEMANAPFLFQLHATSVWLLYAVWPFSRLVHAWSIPVAYLQRAWIPYRSRNPQAALAEERGRTAS